MKKIIYFLLFFLILVVVAVALAPFVVGYQSKQVYTQQVEMYQKQLSAHKNVKLELIEYNLGWMTSTAKILITVTNIKTPLGAISPLVFTVESIIHHGPYLYDPSQDKYAFEKAYVETTISLPEIAKKLLGENALGFIKINSLLSLDGASLLNTYSIEPVMIGGMVKWDGLKADSTIDLADEMPTKIVGNITFGSLSKPFDSNFPKLPSMSMAAIVYNIDTSIGAMEIWNGSSKLTSTGFNVDWQNGKILSGANLAINTTYGIIGNLYNYKTQSTLDTLELPPPSPIKTLKKIKKTISINDLDAAGMKQYFDYVSSNDFKVDDKNEFIKSISKILTLKSNINIAVDMATDLGMIKSDLTCSLSTMPKTEEEMKDNLIIDFHARAAIPLVVKVISDYLPKPDLPTQTEIDEKQPIDTYKNTIVLMLKDYKISLPESLVLLSFQDDKVSLDAFDEKIKGIYMTPATKALLKSSYAQYLVDNEKKVEQEKLLNVILQDPDAQAKKIISDAIEKGYIAIDKNDYVVTFSKKSKVFILNGKDVSTQLSNLMNLFAPNQTKASYSEVVLAASPVKLGVTECYFTLGQLSGCSSGANNVPPAITSPVGAVATMSTVDGVITVTPVAQNGILETDTYILTPKIVDNSLIWETSGGGFKKGYAK